MASDWLWCLEVNTPRNPRTRQQIFDGLRMIHFGEEELDILPEETESSENKTVVSLKLLGSEMTKVIHRIKSVRSSEHLDLTSCSLLQIPGMVLKLVSGNSFISLSLSNNLLIRLNTKLWSSFPKLTELDLSNNNLSSLPSDLDEYENLHSINIS